MAPPATGGAALSQYFLSDFGNAVPVCASNYMCNLNAREFVMKNLATLLAAASLVFSAGLAMAQDAPTDAQIAHIAYTAGVIDIDAGKLALTKAQSEDVRAFAQQMVDDHGAVNDQALALVQKLGVTPEDNATSQALVAAAADEQSKLEALDGAEFDRAYVANEVAFHQQVLDALETTLLPATQNTELKALLETGDKLFQGHLQHAEMVAEGLK